METLQNVLEVLAQELRRSMAALKALPASSREALSVQVMRDRIALEASPEMHDKVVEATVYYAQHLRWPPLSETEASFAHERLAEAVGFAHWLQIKVPQDQKRFAQAWIEWLLIEYWNFAGRARWLERMTALAEELDEPPPQ